jgi:hypothetical protein
LNFSEQVLSLSLKVKGINRQAEVPAIMPFSLFAFSPQCFSLLPPGTVRAGAQSPQGLSHVRHHVRKFLGFRGRNPLNPEALRFQAEVFQHHLNTFCAALGFFITFQVMTFAQVSPTDQDAVGAFGEGVDHQVGVDHARAHHPDDAAVGGILNPGDPGQIRPGIGAPVAAKRHDQRFVLVFH